MEKIENLITQLFEGNKIALSRLITYIEDYSQKAENIRKLVKAYASKYGKIKESYVIGITGPPGCGKSTLIDKLIKEYRKRDKSVGAILVDPSSYKTGGAMLGDRLRMQRHTLDRKVFIRSMATRGYYGGIARATPYVIELMNAYGMDRILVETIGSGQADTEIKKVADVTVVVFTPLSGDEIQFLKCGPMEIADIIVVNKADLPGIDETVMEIEKYLEFELDERKKLLPVIKTVAIRGEGVKELVDEIERLVKYKKR